MSDSPKTPEEALALVKKAAEKGVITFASTEQVDALNSEIQEIFAEIREVLTGQRPKRGIWASDQSRIADVLDFDKVGDAWHLTPESDSAMATVSSKLGIELDRSDLFVDAALRLKNFRSNSPKN